MTDSRLASFALSLFPSSEVLCAYAAPEAQFFGDTTQRWVCFGGFTVPVMLTGRLWCIGFRAPGVTARVALFDPALITDSIVQLASDSDAEVRSLPIQLSPGKSYQLAYQCISAVADGNYMVVRTASLAPE